MCNAEKILWQCNDRKNYNLFYSISLDLYASHVRCAYAAVMRHPAIENAGVLRQEDSLATFISSARQRDAESVLGAVRIMSNNSGAGAPDWQEFFLNDNRCIKSRTINALAVKKIS